MKSKKKIKQILVALGIAFAILIAYAAFSGGFSQPRQQGALVSTRGKNIQGQISEDVDIVNERILKILRNVRNIELDDDIFSNPVFKQLRDTRFTLPRPVQIGRPNPFASIGTESILNAQQGELLQDGTSESTSTFFDDGDEGGTPQ